jgi:DNA-directed RNA polymerase specialized sigma24 family protein
MTIPSPPEPDDQLLARIAAYDYDAFQWFYKTFVDPVRAKLSALGLGGHELEEVADDVLYEMVRKLPTYRREKGRFITLLLTIAKRRAIDYMRKRGWEKIDDRYVPRDVSREALDSRARQKRAVGERMDADEDAVFRYIQERSTADSTEEFDGAETPAQKAAAEFRKWLNGRPESDRIVAEHFMYGTPWEEIARRLSRPDDILSEDAAKMRGSRLKSRVKRELAHLANLFGPAAPAISKIARERVPTKDMEGVR